MSEDRSIFINACKKIIEVNGNCFMSDVGCRSCPLSYNNTCYKESCTLLESSSKIVDKCKEYLKKYNNGVVVEL